MNNGYYAVVLDKKSREDIRKKATMPVVNGDHITLAYKPDDRTFKKLKCLVGKKVDAYYFESIFLSFQIVPCLWVFLLH